MVAKVHNLSGIVTVYRIKQLYPAFKANQKVHWFNLADKLNQILNDRERTIVDDVSDACKNQGLHYNLKSDVTDTKFLIYCNKDFVGVIRFNDIWKRWSYSFISLGQSKPCNNALQAALILKGHYETSKKPSLLFSAW
ncbi:hypothetical protein [Calothrix sp. NIES-2100]|uniref:hypothetical protein n=1 Tax=Calothrix sp. NIES-2100 TaxID=1954172 RepID=UPI0030D9B097